MKNGIQPPSGGCVLKQGVGGVEKQAPFQPPSGGCVLKRKEAVICIPD